MLTLSRRLTQYTTALQRKVETGIVAQPPNMSFMLYGKCSAVSRNHMDSDGAATLVECLSGVKLWAVAVGDVPLTGKDSWKNWSSWHWDVVVLCEGDTL